MYTVYRKTTQLLIVLIAISIFSSCGVKQEPKLTPEWPTITKENKPWTRWWWHGSAVTKEGITADLEALKAGGMGGVEITPIFGVIGEEDNFIDYLSPEWMEMLVYTLQEAKRLDLGVDMATGTGWPFGGPWVGEQDAPKNMAFTTYNVSEGETLNQTIAYTQKPLLRAIGNPVYQLHEKMNVPEEQIPSMLKEPKKEYFGERLEIDQVKSPIAANENMQALGLEQVRFEKQLPLVSLMAYSESGETLDLTEKVSAQGKLDWTGPSGNWTLYAVFQGWHGKMVERAGPGGEGNVIDHFSTKAIDDYLHKFDSAFTSYDLTGMRAYFNDSYEVDDASGEANWTPDFFAEFEKRRGYDLRKYLPALLSEDSTMLNIRVLSDYRETFSDLLLETFTDHWQKWAASKNSIIRNQAHGSPANILDLYAASDIPETEGAEIIKIKMASSAANVTGKQLSSSEAATWLNEHFQSTPGDLKVNLERYLLGGVNHVFYHGTAYSPQDAPWPGWLFYAAVHVNPRNSIWPDIAELNSYIANIQAFMQNSKPDNDVLIYYPIYDRFANKGRSSLEHFGARGPVFEASEVKKDADILQEEGYAFDFISDMQIQTLSAKGKEIIATGGSYQTIVVPKTEFISLSTFEKLVELAKAGGTVIVHESLPMNLNGLGELAVRQQAFESLKGALKFTDSEEAGIQQANMGEGRFLLGDDLNALLQFANIRVEKLQEKGLEYIRKKNDNGTFYYLVNWTDKAVDSWVPLATSAKDLEIFNPLTGVKGKGVLQASSEVSPEASPDGTVQCFIQLAPGESCIVQTYDTEIEDELYPYYKAASAAVALSGKWQITFETGGPEIPAPIETDQLKSWTEFEGEAYQNFSGTAVYKIDIPKPTDLKDGVLLDLGEVDVSARVYWNGKKLNALFGPKYQIVIAAEQWQENNVLEVRVSNLMANRIAWMDKNGMYWKKFYNVNFPARLPENRKFGMFSAENWKPTSSGLLGPVEITPIQTYLLDNSLTAN
ncbi:MAG: glycoside hydrolase family 2 protein [Thalassobius sp.]|nr:glycoside hydrolase family 2 protein [Thalassovita sp.]